MSNKQMVRDLLDRLPDEVTLKDIAHEVEFLDGIREAQEQSERGEYVSVEEIRSNIRQWARSK